MSTTMPRVWIAVDVFVSRDASESIESAFNDLDALGTEIDWLSAKGKDTICVTGFFNNAPAETVVRDAVISSLGDYGISTDALFGVEKRTVEETDWLAEWKKYWRPTEVGKFIVAPPWETIDGTDKIIIRVEPNMAFGTGTHETTQLCLEAISEQYEPSMSMLDVGTGTGILAIAAAKLGGKTILACDTDEDSVKIARENAVLNDVGAIEFFTGTIDESTPQFDFVCANLTLDVISPLLPLLLGRTRRYLILSGILVSQEAEVRQYLKLSKIECPVIRHSGEWLSVTVTVSPASPPSQVS
jgi:ribosomal protein L11 methyltransferase